MKPGQTEITCKDCRKDHFTNNVTVLIWARLNFEKQYSWILSSQKDTIAFAKEHGKLHLNKAGKPFWNLTVHHICDTKFSEGPTSSPIPIWPQRFYPNKKESSHD